MVSGQPSNVPVSLGPPGKGQPGLYQVTLQAQQVATISDIGQYVYDPAAPVYKFGLAKVNGQWRITSLTPPASLNSLVIRAFCAARFSGMRDDDFVAVPWPNGGDSTHLFCNRFMTTDDLQSFFAAVRSQK